MPRLTILGLALVASASVFVNAAPTPGGGLLGGLLGPVLGGGKKDSDNSNDRRPDRESYRDHRRECLSKWRWNRYFKLDMGRRFICKFLAPYGHYDSNCEGSRLMAEIARVTIVGLKKYGD